MERLLAAVRGLLDCPHDAVEDALEALSDAYDAVEDANEHPIPPPSGTRACVLFAAVAGGHVTSVALAERLNMHRRTVSGHLVRLAVDGWFEVEGEKWKGGRHYVPTARARVTVEGARDGVRRAFRRSI